MNYDRLLTRVWDRQEKKMLYHDQKTKYGMFLGVHSEGVVFESDYIDYGDMQSSIVWHAFGDRFVPMMCSGLAGNNKKLIYTADILEGYCIKGCEREKISGVVSFSEVSFGFELNLFNRNIWDDKLYLPLGKLLPGETEIIGNRWENEKLLEANE